jgi:hypothetical protein
MDFDVKTENFEKTRLSIVKLAVWLVYNAFLILYNGYRMMWVSKVPNYDAYGLFRALHSHNPPQYSHIVGLSSHFYAHIGAGPKVFHPPMSKLMWI